MKVRVRGEWSTKRVEKKRRGGDKATLGAYKLRKDAIPQNFNASLQKMSLCSKNSARDITRGGDHSNLGFRCLIYKG